MVMACSPLVEHRNIQTALPAIQAIAFLPRGPFLSSSALSADRVSPNPTIRNRIPRL